MSLLTILAVFGVGLAVGLLSGLVGIGGGALMVPFLYFFYDRPELFGVYVPPDIRTVLAHGTSLFVIVPTSLRGALVYHRSGLVEWRAVWPIGVASVAAAVLGARLALVLPPEVLKVGFGALLVFSGVRLWAKRPAADAEPVAEEPRLSAPLTVFVGVVTGIFSALLGVGGGVLVIPLLLYLIRLDVRRVAGTSIGIVAITATAGSLSYMLGGMGEPGLPPWSLGYVDLAAGVSLFVGAVAAVGWGTVLNRRLRPRTLSLVFAALFVLLGVRLVTTNLQALLAWDAARRGVALLAGG